MVPSTGSRQASLAAVAGASLLKMLLALTAMAAALLLVEIEIKTAASGCCNSEEAFPPANATGLDAAIRELIARQWLSASDSAVCVGPAAAPAAAAMRRLGLRVASVGPAVATPCCGLPLATASYDFAFSAALDRVRVPARVVLEMERVIRPGRFGAVRRPSRPGPAGLARAAAPVAALLRASDVVGALPVDGAAVVVFRKRGGGPARQIPASAAASWCDGEMTKLPRAVDEVIAQLKSAFLPELLKFQSYPVTRSEITGVVSEG